jgi:hypothetical protein
MPLMEKYQLFLRTIQNPYNVGDKIQSCTNAKAGGCI